MPPRTDQAGQDRGQAHRIAAAAHTLLAGATPTAENAFKLPLVERTLAAVLAQAKVTGRTA